MLFIFHFKVTFETRTSTKDCSSPTLMWDELLGMFKLLCGGPFHVFITSWEAGAQPAPSRRDYKLCFGQNEVWSSLTNERERESAFSIQSVCHPPNLRQKVFVFVCKLFRQSYWCRSSYNHQWADALGCLGAADTMLNWHSNGLHISGMLAPTLQWIPDIMRL